MAELTLFNFDEWNALQQAAAQANATLPLDFTIGSDCLALVEANTSSMLYLQADIVQILLLTRAATSTGADLDTFFADFSFPRLQATFTTGVVTLLRDQNTTIVTVPADGSATVLYQNGTPTYTIVADVTEPGYNVGTNSYSAAIGAATLAVTVQATISGTGSNLAIGTALLLGTNTSGFDTATVASGFNNAKDTETDADYRARFVLFLQSLSRGTLAAIGSAILNTQQGLSYTIANNQAPDGTFEPGNFVVTIDDGSGNPPDSLIAAVDANVTAYQGNTISHVVRKPTVIYANVTFTASYVPGTDPTQVNPAVQTAAATYINALALGASLSLSRMASYLLDMFTSLESIPLPSIVVNGSSADLVANKNNVIKASSIVATPQVALT